MLYQHSHRWIRCLSVSASCARSIRAKPQIGLEWHKFQKDLMAPVKRASATRGTIDLENPARHYPKARRIQREVILHIGPTNSGKSHAALTAFKAAQSGYYAGPLRMLAREVYDRMESEGIPCNLVTGDEVLEKDGAMLNSGTVEMVDVGNEMEVAVIDEIQMIEDPDRGWAWTRAFLGVRAKTIHLCGDPSSENIVRAMVRQTGDTLKINRYERLSPLEVIETPLLEDPKKKGPAPRKSLYSLVQPGDCVVCFSKREVQMVRDKIIQAHGNKVCCSIIYGSLPPETRAEQAKLFNNNDSSRIDYLVASDAIGMGLNLGIKRIIFTTLKKFDGQKMRTLEVSEIKQIAGRAGRFRTADGSKGESGQVACLKMADVELVKEAMQSPTPEIKRATLMPPPYLVRSALIGDQTSSGGGKNVIFSAALSDVFRRISTGPYYRRPRQQGALEAAELCDRVKNLTFEDRMVLANAPVPSRLQVVQAAFTEMCWVISRGDTKNVLELFPDMMAWLENDKASGQTLEIIHKTLTLFLWVSYRFPCNFADRAGAFDLKRLCEHQFETILNSRRHLSTQNKTQDLETSTKRSTHPFANKRNASKRRGNLPSDKVSSRSASKS